MSRYKGDNSGGYGNPPVKSQFQKGNKGGGRPKGSRSIESALRKVLNSDVSFKENGIPKTAPAVDALAMRALQHGLSGSYNANEKLLQLAAKHGPQDPPDNNEPPLLDLSGFSYDELRLFNRFMHKATGEELPPEPDLDPYDNTWTNNTVDGVSHIHFRGVDRPPELIGLANRAYWSAALPRRPGCDYDWPVSASSGSSDGDR